MESVNLRPATNADVPAVQELVFGILQEYGLRPAPESTDADLADLEANYFANGGRFDVLETEAGEIVGTVGLHNEGDGVCELRKMYLAPENRGKGWGKRMLDFAIQEAHDLGFKRITLETANVLKDAVVLYERFGFRPIESDHLASRCDQAYFLDL